MRMCAPAGEGTLWRVLVPHLYPKNIVRLEVILTDGVCLHNDGVPCGILLLDSQSVSLRWVTNGISSESVGNHLLLPGNDHKAKRQWRPRRMPDHSSAQMPSRLQPRACSVVMAFVCTRSSHGASSGCRVAYDAINWHAHIMLLWPHLISRSKRKCCLWRSPAFPEAHWTWTLCMYLLGTRGGGW